MKSNKSSALKYIFSNILHKYPNFTHFNVIWKNEKERNYWFYWYTVYC